MSIQNINNGESGLSVRNKLNQVIAEVNTGGLDGTSGTSGTSGAAGDPGTSGTSGTSGAAGSTFQYINDVTLTDTSWSTSGSDFTYRYSNAIILATSRVDVIPQNSTIDIVEDARIYPKIVSDDGFIDIFAKNQPTDDILVDIVVWN
jgi:hypothetical protein